MKPLLEVTNNEEKLSQKEQELKTVSDRFEKVKQERDELERQYVQLAEERGILAQQFRAEAELCAETEEVSLVVQILRSPFKAVFHIGIYFCIMDMLTVFIK